MAFKQPCFIRKNTKEIIDTLIEIGYDKPNEYRNIFTNILTVPSRNGKGSLIGLTDKCADLLLINNGFKTIDCGTNEELFLAIAALRRDTDINQWFIMDVEEYMDINQGDWFIATDRNKGKHIGTQIDPMYCHKATVEELIEHFKKE